MQHLVYSGRMMGSVVGSVSQKRYRNLALGTILRFMLICIVCGRWSQADGYFCANEESNDLASCAYCKLSLDGWEPKDDPL